MISDLSLPTEGLKSSLPVYMFSVNILVCEIEFKSTSDAPEYGQDTRPGSRAREPWIAMEGTQQAKTKFMHNGS